MVVSCFKLQNKTPASTIKTDAFLSTENQTHIMQSILPTPEYATWAQREAHLKKEFQKAFDEEVRVLETENCDMCRRLSALELDLQFNEGKLLVVKDENSRLRSELETLKRAPSTLNRELSAANAEIARLREMHESTVKELEETKAAHGAAVSVLSKELEETKTECDKSRSGFMGAQNSFDQLREWQRKFMSILFTKLGCVHGTMVSAVLELREELREYKETCDALRAEAISVVEDVVTTVRKEQHAHDKVVDRALSRMDFAIKTVGEFGQTRMSNNDRKTAAAVASAKAAEAENAKLRSELAKANAVAGDLQKKLQRAMTHNAQSMLDGELSRVVSELAIVKQENAQLLSVAKDDGSAAIAKVQDDNKKLVARLVAQINENRRLRGENEEQAREVVRLRRATDGVLTAIRQVGNVADMDFYTTADKRQGKQKK